MVVDPHALPAAGNPMCASTHRPLLCPGYHSVRQAFLRLFPSVITQLKVEALQFNDKTWELKNGKFAASRALCTLLSHSLSTLEYDISTDTGQHVNRIVAATEPQMSPA